MWDGDRSRFPRLSMHGRKTLCGSPCRKKHPGGTLTLPLHTDSQYSWSTRCGNRLTEVEDSVYSLVRIFPQYLLNLTERRVPGFDCLQTYGPARDQFAMYPRYGRDNEYSFRDFEGRPIVTSQYLMILLNLFRPVVNSDPELGVNIPIVASSVTVRQARKNNGLTSRRPD